MSTLTHLQRITLFKNLPESKINDVLKLIRVRSYIKDELICHKGDPSEGLYVLFSGKLQVLDVTEDGREIGISIITPDSFFGELGVIDGDKRSASIKALEKSSVGFLAKEYARQLFYSTPEIAEALIHHLAQLIRNSAKDRSLLAIPNVFQRVYVFINQLKTQKNDLILIENMPTQQTIAGMLNTSRETVSRALSLLVAEDIIEKKHRYYIVKQSRKLDDLAKFGVNAEHHYLK